LPTRVNLIIIVLLNVCREKAAVSADRFTPDS